MTFRPNAFAAIGDARFRGIERVDLRARYGAPLDGTLHPLSTMGLAAAQALYPSIGLNGSTALSTFAQDTAAWLQAEYDLRTGSGGIIGLADGAQMVVSAQLYKQNAARVWTHGGRGVLLLTAGTGTTPATRTSNAVDNALAWRNLTLQAKATRVSPSTSGGGVAHTGFAGGSQAFAIDNCQGLICESVNWNGYDQPFAWGDNTYGVQFLKYGASGCNAGFNWAQTAGLNSMERIYLEGGALANNNYGFNINATYGSTGNQGGSITIRNSAIDYNIVRQGVYVGQSGGTYTGVNGLHLINNYLETTGVCSGNSLCRIFSQGSSFFSHNEFFENDGTRPEGFIELAPFTGGSAFFNRINADGMPIFYSTATTPYVFWSGAGNIGQSPNVPVILMKNATGTYLQPSMIGTLQS